MGAGSRCTVCGVINSGSFSLWHTMQRRYMTRRHTDYQPRVGNFHQYYSLALTDGRTTDNPDRIGGTSRHTPKPAQQPCGTGYYGKHQPQTEHDLKHAAVGNRGGIRLCGAG